MAVWSGVGRPSRDTSCTCERARKARMDVASRSLSPSVHADLSSHRQWSAPVCRCWKKSGFRRTPAIGRKHGAHATCFRRTLRGPRKDHRAFHTPHTQHHAQTGRTGHAGRRPRAHLCERAAQTSQQRQGAPVRLSRQSAGALPPAPQKPLLSAPRLAT
eukprot:353934-Chlamydomonas_euryale.AAC.5